MKTRTFAIAAILLLSTTTLLSFPAVATEPRDAPQDSRVGDNNTGNETGNETTNGTWVQVWFNDSTPFVIASPVKPTEHRFLVNVNGSASSIVSLSVTSLPAGYSAYFAPASLTLGANAAQVTLFVTIPPKILPEWMPITIAADTTTGDHDSAAMTTRVI